MNKDEALKMAIEAMDYLSAVVQRQLSTKSKQEYSLVLYKDAINACKEALEQPTQEPVATVRSYNGLVGFHANQKQINILKDKHEHPLYLHPHQWQGLADDEIIDMYFQANISPQPAKDVIDFIRAIEQSLKDKNT